MTTPPAMQYDLPQTSDPAVGSTRLLADAYRKAGELCRAFEDAQWSRSLTRRDCLAIGQLEAKAQNLRNMIYLATQANTKLSGGGDKH